MEITPTHMQTVRLVDINIIAKDAYLLDMHLIYGWSFRRIDKMLILSIYMHFLSIDFSI